MVEFLHETFPWWAIAAGLILAMGVFGLYAFGSWLRHG
jgi:ABC-type dipeptide/oligopeptide/nickel transport system permease subunit